jgi:hypothetical protein
LVDNPTQTREKVRAILKDETATESVEVVGVKPTSQTTVKVFVDLEESVANLRRAMHWLSALPGAKLQEEQWLRSHWTASRITKHLERNERTSPTR